MAHAYTHTNTQRKHDTFDTRQIIDTINERPLSKTIAIGNMADDDEKTHANKEIDGGRRPIVHATIAICTLFDALYSNRWTRVNLGAPMCCRGEKMCCTKYMGGSKVNCADENSRTV